MAWAIDLGWLQSLQNRRNHRADGFRRAIDRDYRFVLTRIREDGRAGWDDIVAPRHPAPDWAGFRPSSSISNSDCRSTAAHYFLPVTGQRWFCVCCAPRLNRRSWPDQKEDTNAFQPRAMRRWKEAGSWEGRVLPSAFQAASSRAEFGIWVTAARTCDLKTFRFCQSSSTFRSTASAPRSQAWCGEIATSQESYFGLQRDCKQQLLVKGNPDSVIHINASLVRCWAVCWAIEAPL